MELEGLLQQITVDTTNNYIAADIRIVHSKLLY
jgi:hypothetical protein